EVFDEGLHPVRGLREIVQVDIPVTVELFTILLLEQLYKTRDGAQRFLQIVGGDIRELLQLFILALHLAGALPDLFFERVIDFPVLFFEPFQFCRHGVEIVGQDADLVGGISTGLAAKVAASHGLGGEKDFFEALLDTAANGDGEDEARTFDGKRDDEKQPEYDTFQPARAVAEGKRKFVFEGSKPVVQRIDLVEQDGYTILRKRNGRDLFVQLFTDVS